MTRVIPPDAAGIYPRFVRNRLLYPTAPERICWGCDKYCPADDLACGNGTIRTPHPVELFGQAWLEWSRDSTPVGADTPPAAAATSNPEEVKP